jgi:hypothetical protein
MKWAILGTRQSLDVCNIVCPASFRKEGPEVLPQAAEIRNQFATPNYKSIKVRNGEDELQ